VTALRIATRGSQQARTQAEHVAARLAAAAGSPVELVLIETSGDRQRDRPISELGGRGVFVKEVQQAVLDGRADLAVHSAKDLPSSWTTPGLVLRCVPLRRDPRDALVGSTLAGLAPGAVVATGSVRRQAQLAHLRPDIGFVGLRGNIPTRVARAGTDGVDAVVVAMTGVTWVGLRHLVAEALDVDVMVPQVGQGAMAIECREDDSAALAALSSIEHAPSRRRVDCERAFLARLGGGCDLPVGAYAEVVAGGAIHVRGVMASLDGRVVLRETRTGHDPSVGAALADALLAAGGNDLLEAHGRST
jgi:hydroxymethylbilane synthase